MWKHCNKHFYVHIVTHMHVSTQTESILLQKSSNKQVLVLVG